MRRSRLARLLAAATAIFAVAGVSAALAQPAGNSLNNRWPGDPEPEDAAPPPAQQRQQPAPRQAPAQVQRPQQPAPQQPAQVQRPQQAPPAPRQQQAAPQQQPPIATEEPPAAAPAPPPKPRAPVQAATPPRAITCSGVFAKESSHTKLAAAFGAGNVTWAQVDGPDATKLNASVLFPRDAKRRLEVLWTNEDERTDTQVIVINGQSTWTGPKGVKLGTTLAALEKLNGKPFTMKGFKGDNGGLVTSWEGGALDKLGNCRVGVRFGPDPKAPAPHEGEADALVSDKDFLSNAPAVRSLAPKIAEIIIGY